MAEYIEFKPKENYYRVVTKHEIDTHKVVEVQTFSPSENEQYNALFTQDPGEGFYFLFSLYLWETTFRKDHNEQEG